LGTGVGDFFSIPWIQIGLITVLPFLPPFQTFILFKVSKLSVLWLIGFFYFGDEMIDPLISKLYDFYFFFIGLLFTTTLITD